MPIEFRKQTDVAPTSKERAQMPPVRPASKAQAEERLFHFLRSVSDGRPQASRPLFVEEATLHAIYSNPHPDLVSALQHCLDQFLVDLGPDAALWGRLDLPTTLFGVALAAYNSLCPLAPSEEDDPVIPFTTALIDTLPCARTLSEMLAYHALLGHISEFLTIWPQDRANLLQALLNRSPLSTLYTLHLYTPSPLTLLASEMWPWWKERTLDPAPWANLEDWLQSLTPLLAQPALARHLRNHWLSLPETLTACRNLGLFLEALQRQGDQRAFILEFYEAFDRLRAKQVMSSRHNTKRSWPLLDQIKRLLSADGDDEAAIQLNRRGNEYFLLFLPLLQIIIADDSPPNDYYHLTLFFIQTLRSLFDLTTDYSVLRPALGTIEFSSEDTP